MIWIYRLLILLVSGTVFNVWLIRKTHPTPYRGAEANSLKEEFLAYGLSEPIFYTVGGLKLLAALALLIGLGVKSFVKPAAQIIVVLMIGAIAMHLKVGDPLLKSLPALIMLGMSITIFKLHKKV